MNDSNKERTFNNYFGIDLGADSTIISFFDPSMKEPESVSTVLGLNEFEIPTRLAKRNGLDQWFYGKEADSAVKSGIASEAYDLFNNAILSKEIAIDGRLYQARDLLYMFVRHLLEMSGRTFQGPSVRKFVVTLPELNLDSTEMAAILCSKLSIPEDRLVCLDHIEAFYYYALSQDSLTFLHDVLLIDLRKQEIRYVFLSLDRSTTPVTVNIESGLDQLDKGQKDEAFLDFLKKILSDHGKVTSVYLVGDGFDGSWLSSSLEYLLSGRRVFIGKNLYSKGSCYGGIVKDGVKEWNYVYIGSNELKMNVSLKVSYKNKMSFYTLNNAGESWFQCHGSCEVILLGSNEVEIWIQRPDSRKAVIEKLILDGLPDQSNGDIRLRISCDALSDRKVKITIKDLGFGEISPGSGKTWEHEFELPEE